MFRVGEEKGGGGMDVFLGVVFVGGGDGMFCV